ncbi:MAG: helix-turn-helix transcriptional regulator [Nostocaceae cyanobacterium]|nr:helix-turn-helix transcriptional regulator [Nostocaceae cyanobacterium]
MSENQDLQQESPLKRRREELGLSQREVASAINVSVQTISNWETGRYKEADDFSLTTRSLDSSQSTQQRIL